MSPCSSARLHKRELVRNQTQFWALRHSGVSYQFCRWKSGFNNKNERKRLKKTHMDDDPWCGFMSIIPERYAGSLIWHGTSKRRIPVNQIELNQTNGPSFFAHYCAWNRASISLKDPGIRFDFVRLTWFGESNRDFVRTLDKGLLILSSTVIQVTRLAYSVELLPFALRKWSLVGVSSFRTSTLSLRAGIVHGVLEVLESTLDRFKPFFDRKKMKFWHLWLTMLVYELRISFWIL